MPAIRERQEAGMNYAEPVAAPVPRPVAAPVPEPGTEPREPRSRPGQVRLSVNLSEEAAEALRSIRARRGGTITDTVRRVISIAKFIEDATDQGAKILVAEKNQPIKEVVFPR